MRASSKILLCLFLGALLLAPTRVLAAEDEDPYEEIEDDEAAKPAEEVDDEPDVFELDDKDFDESLKKVKYALVMFYAPWCGHCKSLKPEYSKAATQLKENKEVILAKVDATVATELGKRFDVQGYPTLKWFVDGELASDYQAGRTAEALVAWVKKKTGAPTTEIKTVDELKEKKEAARVLVVGYFKKLEGDLFKDYEKVASALEDAEFFATTSADVAKELGLKAEGAFALGRNWTDHGYETVVSEGHAAFKDAKESLSDKLKAFILAEKLPAYLAFKPENQGAIFQGGISKQVITIAPEEKMGKDGELLKTLKKVADKFRGKLVFVTSTLEAQEGQPIVQFFGLDANATDAQIVGFDASASKKFKFGGEVAVEDLEKFAAGVVEGTAPKFFKSAPEPEEPTEGGVTVVVGNTVESIVLDPTKDVLLEVYAPWCGHCKQLAPTYEKLAKRFAKVDSVVIAKMDGTTNEHPAIDAKGYPTLLFFKAEKDAEPLPYDQGGRSLADLTKFIKTHAKVPFELPKKKKKVEKEGATEAEEKHEEL